MTNAGIDLCLHQERNVGRPDSGHGAGRVHQSTGQAHNHAETFKQRDHLGLELLVDPLDGRIADDPSSNLDRRVRHQRKQRHVRVGLL